MPRTRFTYVYALLTLAAAFTPALADTITVPGDQPTIQAAIDIALDGDEIVVSPGTYNETLLIPDISITLRSSDGPQTTVIDASNAPGGPSSVIRMDKSTFQPTHQIEGFTITGGTGWLNPGFPESGTFGGGIASPYTSVLEVRDCIIENNQADTGGGISKTSGVLKVSNSIIRNNSANYKGKDIFGNYGNGGGINAFFIEGLEVTDSTFENNHAPNRSGGAIFNESSMWLDISGCEFESNSSNSTGGAIFSSFSSQFSVSRCEFRNNSTTGASPAMEYGGGAIALVDVGAFSRVSRSSFYGNHTSGFNTTGGAINFGMGAGMGMLIDGCVFAENSSLYAGGAVGLNGSELILNCTFANNSAVFGQAIFADDFTFGVSILNSIIWGNGAGAPVFDVSNMAITMDYSIVEGGWGGFGSDNLDADPMFVDATNQDLSLMPGSPANDSGDTFAYLGLPVADLDFAGNPRLNDDPQAPLTGLGFMGQCIDRGAFEFQPATASACLADLNNDGLLNFFDVSIFLTLYGAGCP
jgi:hypothetical protein